LCCDHQARSRKAFDIRLENLQKSKAEKEEIHRKLQDKYTKEMAEFEKKVRSHIHIILILTQGRERDVSLGIVEVCGHGLKNMSLLCPQKAAAEKEQEQRLKELEEHWRMVSPLYQPPFLTHTSSSSSTTPPYTATHAVSPPPPPAQVRAEYKEKKRMARAALHQQHSHLLPSGPNSSAGHTPTSSASSSPLPPPHDKPVRPHPTPFPKANPIHPLICLA
jgi:hypothetical protein